jgi:hypothetical protein
MRLFVLAGMATAFTGMAFAQTPGTATCTATANAVFARAESNDDQVADTTLTCNSGANGITAGQTASMTVYLSPSVNITSANIGTSNTPVSEATAGLNATATTFTGGAAQKFGSVSGNSVTFSNITFPANIAANTAFSMTITNIKIASSTVATSSGVPTGVSETIFLSGTAMVPAAVTTGSAVAYVTNGLSNIKANNATSNPLCNSTTAYGINSSNAANNIIASGPIGTTAVEGTIPYNFNVAFGEAFPNSFRTAGTVAINNTLGSWYVNHTETGYGVTSSVSNQATSGTRIKVIFNNIPPNVTVYVPISIGGFVPNATATASTTPFPETSANLGVITLTASETGAFSAVAGSTASGAPGGGNNVAGTAIAAPLTVTSGSATAIYEVTTVSTAPAVFTVPVFLAASSGAVTAPTSAITATVSYAPIGATSNVPNFINGSSTATVNGSTFAACSTTLLFPFVTNQAGFESGLAISNTGTDLLGVKSGAPVSSVTGQSGTCVLTFFGNATASSNPPAFTTAAAVTPGTSWTGTLTSVTGGTPNTFGGYMIANCNFLFAHGFTYITYNIGQSSGMAMGYLALELTQATRGGNSSTASVAATNEGLNN